MVSPAPPAPDASIATLRLSHDRLRTVAESLSPQQLRRPGYPAAWSIAQVLSHLGSGAEISTLALEAGLAGEDAPPREAYPPIWDRWNSKSPGEQAADAVKTDALLVEKVEAHSDSAATFAIWSGQTDINGLAASRLGEHAVHTWDIAVAVDPAATILPEAVAIIVDRLGELVGLSAKPSSWTGLLRVTTFDPARELALSLGQKSSLGPWQDGEAAAHLDLPAEALIRLVYGRLDVDHAPSVAATGIDLDDLRAVFRGF